MRVAILGGYHPTQSVGAVFRAFERAGHTVWHVPTMPTFKPALDEFKADLLFTFKIGLDRVMPGYIASLRIPHKVFWSFDDPHWIEQGREVHWAREHHLALTSCQESVGYYYDAGVAAHFLPPAMDVHIYEPTTTVETALTSFICTTLYPRTYFPANLIDRRDMINRLFKTFGQDFALYGFNAGIADHPACRGLVQWETSLPQALLATRMNINNHLTAERRLYFNERFFQIVSTRKAMFCDRVAGFTDLFGDLDGNFIWYSSLDELVEKLLYWKDRPKELAFIGAGGFACMRGWTYDEFVKQVLVAIDGGTPLPAFMQR